MTGRNVVDTNVLIVANERDSLADPQCQLACIELLERIGEAGVVFLLDDRELIMTEYARYCSYSGAPGVGDIFFKTLYDRQYTGGAVERIAVWPVPDPSRGFDNLPENRFDPSDRKFLSVAKAGHGRVVNATESDWSEHKDFVVAQGVEVTELCPHRLRRSRR